MGEKVYVSGQITAVFPRPTGVEIIVETDENTKEEKAIFLPNGNMDSFERGEYVSGSCEKRGPDLDGKEYYQSR